MSRKEDNELTGVKCYTCQEIGSYGAGFRWDFTCTKCGYRTTKGYYCGTHAPPSFACPKYNLGTCETCGSESGAHNYIACGHTTTPGQHD